MGLLQTRTISILKEQVSDIKTGDYKKEVQQLKVLMNEMQKNHQRQMSEQQRNFSEQQRQFAEQQRNFSEQQRHFAEQQSHTRTSSCCIFLTYLVYSTVLFLSSVTVTFY